MSKIRVAILGYGNLGKALEKELLKTPNVELVGIFSRRPNIKSNLLSPVYSRNKLINCKKKIDILAISSGSKTDVTIDAPLFSRLFNTINTFDTHALIPREYENLNQICKECGTISIMSAGWDPGLFSQTRAMFYSILETNPICFWGKGTSLGHSDAVKRVAGVLDAIAFTVPERNAITLSNQGLIPPEPRHTREVYALVKDDADKNKISHQIKTMDNYFSGQPTTVTFVTVDELNKMKNFSHAGQIIAVKLADNNVFKLKLETEMSSNPQMTAMIVASYIKAFPKIKVKYPAGAYTPLHFSPLDLVCLNDIDAIKKFC